MILTLLFITLIMVLIFDSGFPFEMDRIISNRFKFHHLPEKPFLCLQCATVWTLIAYLLIVGRLSIVTLLLALAFSKATTLLSNIVAVINAALLKITGIIMRYLD